MKCTTPQRPHITHTTFRGRKARDLQKYCKTTDGKRSPQTPDTHTSEVFSWVEPWASTHHWFIKRDLDTEKNMFAVHICIFNVPGWIWITLSVGFLLMETDMFRFRRLQSSFDWSVRSPTRPWIQSDLRFAASELAPVSVSSLWVLSERKDQHVLYGGFQIPIRVGSPGAGAGLGPVPGPMGAGGRCRCPQAFSQTSSNIV